MKILFLTENFPPETNASATRVFERAQYWVKWGHEVTILTSAPNFPGGRLHSGFKNEWRNVSIVNGLRVVRVKTYIAPNEGTLWRTLDFISFMFSAFFVGMFEKRPDIVVATSPQFFAAIGGWVLALFRKLPFVFELGDLWPASIVAVGAMKQGPLINLVEKLELYLYRRSAAVVALTESFREDLIKREIDGNKIAVVINGVDLWRYEPRPTDSALKKAWGLEGKFIVGYIGTHGMAHSLKNVLNAAQIVRGHSEIAFLFVGAGAERQGLIDFSKRQKLNNVHFAPNQPKQVMPNVWSICDIALVHLRDTEIFESVIPSKIFEAMAMNVPMIIAAPRGEASRIVNQEKVGLHVPAEHPERLADTVWQLYSDKILRSSLASNCKDSVKQFSREIQAQRFIEVLEIVVDGKGQNVANLLPSSGPKI